MYLNGLSKVRSQKPVTGPRFEIGISRIQVQIANAAPSLSGSM